MQDLTRRCLTVWVVLLVALSAMPAVAVADNDTNVSDRAPYYDNNSTQLMNESWMQNNSEPTAENVTSMFTRLGSFVVGSGVRGQQVWAGPLVLGLVFAGAAIGALAGSAGVVAGAVVGFALVRGLVVLGLAPQWVWPVSLFALGLILTAVYIRLQR